MSWENLCNYITLARIVSVPLIALLFLFPYSQSIGWYLFILAWISDLLDGYIARAFGFVTKIGGLLDSYADKVLVITCLMLLSILGKLPNFIASIAAIVIVLRELLVFLLKLASYLMNIELGVSKGAKLKAFLQMLSIALLFCRGFVAQSVGFITLLLAAVLSITTALEYYWFFVYQKTYPSLP